MQKTRKRKWAFVKGLGLAVIVSAFFLPCYQKIVSTGNNIFYLSLNGVQVGCSDRENAADCLRQARKQLAVERDSLLMLDAKLSAEGKEVYFGKIDSEKKIIANMTEVLKRSEKETLERSYTIKINDFTINLASSGEVAQLLEAVLDEYDTEDQYGVRLVMDPERELNVLTTQIFNRDEEREKEKADHDFHREIGADAYMDQVLDEIEPDREKLFSEYELGLVSLAYGETVEIVEAYMPKSECIPVSQAIGLVTKKQEKNKIYEVSSGDTLSQIAEDNGLSLERLIEINPAIENANSMIRIGDEIIVTSPEPELSVIRREQLYYEEDYDAEVVYIDNDSWYTTEKVTRQEPSAGHRKAVAIVTYRNDSELGREIQKEEVTIPAVAKIVERGTKIPPTFLKPISGGRTSSSFGKRKAPTKGASTYHKGIDWAVPTGTAVMASSGGTVTKAGWGSGYGYVVYIDHGDGRQTRYAHLSKVLVKAGQKVVQGQKIALSGNTGRSTGPHLHFEILIGGGHVNPLNYLS